METSSLVEQYHNSPELVSVAKWSLGILIAGYGVLWALILSHINKKFTAINERFKDVASENKSLNKNIVALELETKTNYVSYTVFNALMKEFKDEIHTSMGEVKDELREITVFLRDASKK